MTDSTPALYFFCCPKLTIVAALRARHRALVQRVTTFGAHDRIQPVRAGLQSSDMVPLPRPNSPVLNCPFLIFSANSIPLIVIAALFESF